MPHLVAKGLELRTTGGREGGGHEEGNSILLQQLSIVADERGEELRIVVCGGEDAAAAAHDLAVDNCALHWAGLEFAVAFAFADLRAAGDELGVRGEVKGCGAHVERAQDVCFHVLFEGAVGEDLDESACPVDIYTVNPSIATLELQWEDVGIECVAVNCLGPTSDFQVLLNNRIE